METHLLDFLKVSLVSKDSSMLDGLENASVEMEEAKVGSIFVAVLMFPILSRLRRKKYKGPLPRVISSLV